MDPKLRALDRNQGPIVDEIISYLNRQPTYSSGISSIEVQLGLDSNEAHELLSQMNGQGLVRYSQSQGIGGGHVELLV